MTVCEICQASSHDRHFVFDVFEEYQVDGIKQVCRPCGDKIDAAVVKMNRIAQKLVEGRVKAFIRTLVEKCMGHRA